MISDDRLHKTRFCKKREGANQNFSHKEGGWSKRRGLEQFRILRRGVCLKREGDFFKGGSYPDAHYVKFIISCFEAPAVDKRFLTVEDINISK